MHNIIAAAVVMKYIFISGLNIESKSIPEIITKRVFIPKDLIYTSPLCARFWIYYLH